MILKSNGKHIFTRDIFLLTISVSLIVLAGYLNTTFQKPTLTLSKQDSALNIDKDLLTFMSAGNKRLITDLLWIQTLIESDLEHYAKRDLNNWLFIRFNTIAKLDPKFYENFLYGGQFLSVVKDDLEGAEVILEKGVEAFPNDYHLNYLAGFLNYYELGNFEKGIIYLKRIQSHPKAPIFIKSIIHKLELEEGASLEEVFELVLHHYETASDEALKLKLQRDLYSIKSEIDLKCLNNDRANCSLVDFNGNHYIKRNNTYFTKELFQPFRINKRGRSSQVVPASKINTFK